MLESFLQQSARKRVLFFSGKGGVGKSAIAWATAHCLKQRSKKVAVVSWSPFDTQSKGIPFEDLRIPWLQLDTMSAFQEYVLQILKFEKIYSMVFDNPVLKTFVRVAPGLPETVIAGKVWNLSDQQLYDTIVVDLPSTGHALSFFESPIGIHKLFGKGFVHREADKILKMFQSPDTGLHLVTLPEELPLQESKEFKNRLEKIVAIPFGHLVINQCLPNFSKPASIDNAALEKVWSHYETEQSHETDTLTSSESLGLPIVKVPKVPAKSFIQLVEQISQQLEMQ